jgi:hypothetical protein
MTSFVERDACFTARAAIQACDGGRHPWPIKEKVRVYHGTYFVPACDGRSVPLMSTPSRLYFAFELGWAVSPVVWFEVPPGPASSAFGTAFPSRPHRRMTLGAASSIDRADQSWQPGRLLVAFRQPIDDAALSVRLAEILPASRRITRLATNACYVSCPAFDEPAWITAVFRAPEVQYADKVMHAWPVTARGGWRLRALTD